MVWTPSILLSVFVFILRMIPSFIAHNTEADLALKCRGRVQHAIQCVACTYFFLKQTGGMEVWLIVWGSCAQSC